MQEQAKSILWIYFVIAFLAGFNLIPLPHFIQKAFAEDPLDNN